jgi:hypothetical protein
VEKLWTQEPWKISKKDVTITLVFIEQEFPPFFFDIMTNLLMHLVEELEICVPIHTHWMYLMKRYMKALKGYVWNKTRLEGSMVEDYAIEEAFGFAPNTKCRV